MSVSDDRQGFAAFPLSSTPAAVELAVVADRGGRSTLSTWNDASLDLAGSATHFGFVAFGTAMLITERGEFALPAGMYFSVPGEGRITGTGCGFVASRHDYRGFFSIGGPIERTGRLRYIDGCSDSLLIPPVRKGDPCLNLLHVPAGVDQTAHTHPSHRIGVVVSGEGECRTAGGTVSLAPGLSWIIYADQLHSFHTTDRDLRIVAYHPDSDFGPTDQNHPMLNRTIIPAKDQEQRNNAL